MGDPSRPADDISLLRSALALARGAKAALPADSPAVAGIDGVSATLDELLKRAAGRGPNSASSSANSTLTGSETILVVEDNETILTLITNALARLGYRVLSAGDGPTALQRYGRSADDIKLLVTDVMMPRMSGRELALQMAALRPSMKVLFASGYSQDVTSRRGVFDADVNFIMKPYTPQGLAARIRQLLDAPPA